MESRAITRPIRDDFDRAAVLMEDRRQVSLVRTGRMPVKGGYTDENGFYDW